MVVMVHGEGLMGEDSCSPDFYVVVLKLVFAVSLHGRGLGSDGGEESERERGKGEGTGE
jgi:hypothetical protein